MTVDPRPPAATDPRPVARHHPADEAHPDADRPCVIEAEHGIRPDGTPRYIGHCATHSRGGRGYTNQSFGTEAEAVAMTRCDRGRMWCFTVVHTDDHDLPDMVSLSGLWELVHGLGMATYHDAAMSCCAGLGLYRFDPRDGTNQWLTLTLSPRPGGFLVDVRTADPTGGDDDPREHCDTRDCGHDYGRDGVTYLHEIVPLP